MLSAVSATIAAVLVAVNLYLSGRREQSRWAREALVDVFVAFLNAGFVGAGAVTRLVGLPPTATDAEVRRYRDEIAEAHRSETEMLTRMRLLTTPVVVEAAVDLHMAVHTCTDLAETRRSDRLADANDRIWEARHRFLAAAKSEIGLDPAVSPVRHQSSR
jgi:hypothetical protein